MRDEMTVILMLLFTAAVTVMLRLLPLFVKLPEDNPFINKFFEALPYTVLILLIFPDIFTSTGKGGFELVKVFTGIGVIIYFSLKKFGLGIVILVAIAVMVLFDIVRIAMI